MTYRVEFTDEFAVESGESVIAEDGITEDRIEDVRAKVDVQNAQADEYMAEIGDDKDELFLEAALGLAVPHVAVFANDA